MKYYISDVLWKSVQAFIFSFVTAPAVALLLVLFCTTLTSSPSRAFLDQARSLVGNATSTTVMVCSDEKAAFVAFRSSDCPRHAVNADDAIEQWDLLLLKTYLVVAGIAFACWMLADLFNYRRKPWRYGNHPAEMTRISLKSVPKESDDDADK